MSTGPEHYLEAERLLDRIQRGLEEATPNTVSEVLAVSQVGVAVAQAHATLAQVAATAGAYAVAPDGANVSAWAKAITAPIIRNAS